MLQRTGSVGFGSRACFCKHFKEPRNRFPALRNQFLGSLSVYKYGFRAHCKGVVKQEAQKQVKEQGTYQ
jgi:hypothetical protein